MTGGYDAFLFDFDGVLADTEPLHWAAWNDALTTIGVSIAWEEYSTHCVGISDEEFASRVGSLSTPRRETHEVFSLYSLKKKRFSERAAQIEMVDSSTLDALKLLQPKGMAVVTSSSRCEIEPILLRSGVLDVVSAAVYGDDVARLKPHPEPYLLAKEKLGARCALVFEDSPAGLESARAAGCDVVEVHRPSALPDLIRRHSRRRA